MRTFCTGGELRTGEVESDFTKWHQTPESRRATASITPTGKKCPGAERYESLIYKRTLAKCAHSERRETSLIVKLDLRPWNSARLLKLSNYIFDH